MEERFVQAAFPGARILEQERLTEGLRNSNFKLRVDSVREPVVLRIYEHDPVLCQKELDLLELVRGTVPVPEVIHAEPQGCPPFMVYRWIEGVTFRELRRGGDRQAIAQAAQSVGEVLAGIHQYGFPKGGWLSSGPTVTWPLMEGPHEMARFVDVCLASANLQARVPGQVREGVHALMWSRLDELGVCEEQSQLVHGDFSRRNVLVRESNGRWGVAAILDWEFAVAGTVLGDFGNFLRYEPAERPMAEPHFSEGYRRGGGILPDNWCRLARVVDLVTLCEMLAREVLPHEVAAELAELVAATVEGRDP